jgi:hypothetical protein
MKDITYTQDKLFTTFYANTPSGVEAWNTMADAEGMNGVAKVFNGQLAGVIAQLKKAGYSVGKEPASKLSIDDILNELGA